MAVNDNAELGFEKKIWDAACILRGNMDAANRLISELKTKIALLTKELSEYKSIRGKLHTAGLEQENEVLKGKPLSYEAVI